MNKDKRSQDKNNQDKNNPDKNNPDKNNPDKNNPDKNNPDKNNPDKNNPDKNNPDKNYDVDTLDVVASSCSSPPNPETLVTIRAKAPAILLKAARTGNILPEPMYRLPSGPLSRQHIGAPPFR